MSDVTEAVSNEVVEEMAVAPDSVDIGQAALDAAIAIEADSWNEEVVEEAEEELETADNTEIVEEVVEEIEVVEEPEVAEVVEEPEVKAPEIKAGKFDELLSKEINLREREAELKTKSDGMRTIDDFKELVKTNPLKFLEEVGMSFDEFADIIIQEPKTKDPLVKDLEDRLGKFERQAEQSRMADYVAELDSHVEAGDYELVKALGAQQLVIDTIVANWQKDGTQLDFDAACELVETYLLENEVPKLERIRAIKKYADKTESVKELPAVETVPKVKKKTLKNKAATKAPARKAKGRVSPDEALANAIRLESELWEG